MGLFTTIKEDNGSEWQFKTGFDDLEVFKVGDSVVEARRVQPRWPGEEHLGDGVYDGVCSSDCGGRSPKETTRCWIVIKDGKVLPLESWDENTYLSLYAKHGIQPAHAELWSTKEWAELAKRQYLEHHEQQLLKAEMEGMTSMERLAFLSSRHVRRQLREEGFIRKILPPLEEPDLPASDEPDEPIGPSGDFNQVFLKKITGEEEDA